MAAAVHLTKLGHKVTVFEASRTLGGRARRIDSRLGTLDNGQHILIGAYRELLQLIETVAPGSSTKNLLRTPISLNFPGHFHLAAPRLPAPWHLLAALFTAKGLGWADRIAALKFLLAMRKANYQLAQDCTVETLLSLYSQTEALKCWLWHPLCLSALNTPVERASAQVFLNVLRDTFTFEAQASDLLYPTCDLTALFPEPAAAWLMQKGAALHTGCSVTGFVSTLTKQYRLSFLQAAHNAFSEQKFDALILAVPAHRIPALTAGHPELEPVRTLTEAFTYEPILTAYLSYPQAVAFPSLLCGLTNATADWVFDGEALQGNKGLVIALASASARLTDKFDRATLIDQLHADVVSVCGPLPTPTDCLIVEDKRATFACTPDLQRPSSVTALPGVFLAGDYVAGDYPATLEGAVRSGRIAAQNVCAQLKA